MLPQSDSTAVVWVLLFHILGIAIFFMFMGLGEFCGRHIGCDRGLVLT